MYNKRRFETVVQLETIRNEFIKKAEGRITQENLCVCCRFGNDFFIAHDARWTVWF